MKRKLPRFVIFHHDLFLAVFRPRGILNDKIVSPIIAWLDAEEDQAGKAFNRFTDLSKLDAVDLNLDKIFRFSLHRRAIYKRDPVKSAFYVTSPATARVVRWHVLLTDRSPLKVKMFNELAVAAKWLGVSEEELELEV